MLCSLRTDWPFHFGATDFERWLRLLVRAATALEIGGWLRRIEVVVRQITIFPETKREIRMACASGTKIRRVLGTVILILGATSRHKGDAIGRLCPLLQGQRKDAGALR